MKQKNLLVSLFDKRYYFFFLLLSTFILVSCNQPINIPGTGYSCLWGSPDCNPCVFDAKEAFDNVKKRGEVMGLRKGMRFSSLIIDRYHCQGIQRIMAGDGKYYDADG